MSGGGTPAPRYGQAGVSLESGEESVRRIRGRVRATFGPRVESQIGAFAGFFSYPDPASERLLVSSMDGVGTKLRVAAAADAWEGVGYDIVSHCVNDIFVHGARPLFFLDYIGAGSLDPSVVDRLIAGMVEACTLAGCALIGGETAEMPGMYAAGELDLVGCIIGDVARSDIVDGRSVKPGDRLIGLPSDGLHTNGYSLARRILLDDKGLRLDDPVPGVDDTVSGALLRRHRMYMPVVGPLLARLPVRAMAHITGGGIPGNLPRVLPAGLRGRVDRSAWQVPPLFRAIQDLGGVAEAEMFHVFNMGIGFVLAVPPDAEEAWLDALRDGGVDPVRLGEVEGGEGGVVWDPEMGP